MKLCFIVNQLYKSGGIERTITHRLNKLSKYHDIFLITLENGDRPYFFGEFTGVKCIDLNVDFERKFNGSFKKNTANIHLSLRSYLRLHRAIQRIKPDFTINVVGTHSFWLLPFIPNTGIKVLEHHSSFYDYKSTKLKKCIFNNYDYHIFLTEEECFLANFIKKRKIVIPNPVQTDVLENIPYKLKKNRIIAAGRIVDIKGFDRLVEAWRIIHFNFPDWIVEVYGEPDLEVLSKLKKLINDYNLESSFFIRPATKNIVNIINDSKIYAMTSHFESFSIVLLEAISVGTLVVAFDCPTGPRNIIDANTGYLVNNDEIKLYAETLKYAISFENDASIIASGGYKQSQKFSLNEVIRKWNILFSHQI